MQMIYQTVVVLYHCTIIGVVLLSFVACVLSIFIVCLAAMQKYKKIRRILVIGDRERFLPVFNLIYYWRYNTI